MKNVKSEISDEVSNEVSDEVANDFENKINLLNNASSLNINYTSFF